MLMLGKLKLEDQRLLAMVQLDQWLLQTMVQLMHLMVVIDRIQFLVALFFDKCHMIV